MATLEITIDVEFDVLKTSNRDLWPRDDRWKDHAVCKGRTALFFPPRAERPQARARRERHALRLCNECPVQAACQQSARANHEYGFWGGESEEERHLAGYTVSAPIGIRARYANS
jgi:WhiB family redox-sensing transcriptional regulator